TLAFTGCAALSNPYDDCSQCSDDGNCRPQHEMWSLHYWLPTHGAGVEPPPANVSPQPRLFPGPTHPVVQPPGMHPSIEAASRQRQPNQPKTARRPKDLEAKNNDTPGEPEPLPTNPTKKPQVVASERAVSATLDAPKPAAAQPIPAD